MTAIQEMCGHAMYDDYFTSDGEVRPEFRKEFVSIFSGWLGTANLHKLDEVTEEQWSRFNDLLKALYRSAGVAARQIWKMKAVRKW